MRKRSTYRPYRVDPGAALHTIAMQHGMNSGQLQDLGLAMHGAIERMRTGHGVESDFHDLAATVNVSLILCERGTGAEYEQIVKDAQHALMRTLERGRKTGRWGFDGEGYTQITRAVALHEQQIALVPRVECVEAMNECRRRMERGQVLND